MQITYLCTKVHTQTQTHTNTNIYTQKHTNMFLLKVNLIMLKTVFNVYDTKL